IDRAVLLTSGRRVTDHLVSYGRLLSEGGPTLGGTSTSSSATLQDAALLPVSPLIKLVLDVPREGSALNGVPGSIPARGVAAPDYLSRSSNGPRNLPVCDWGASATCAGVPVAMIWPPPEPPSRPISTIQSAALLTSTLCSITTRVLPWSRSRRRRSSSCRMPAKCRPVVGSSRMYRVLPVSRLDSSRASFTRWASPPDRVVADWPRRTKDRPTSISVCSLRASAGTASKNSRASSMVISSTSWMFFPLYLTSSVSRL